MSEKSTSRRHAKSGTIMAQLLRLGLPVIASSFMSMAYNFINLLFIGRLGSDAVAAVGSASFYMHLSWGLSSLFTVGAGIRVSHAIGRRSARLSRGYVKNGLLAIVLLALLCMLLLNIGSHWLIGLLHLNDPAVCDMAAKYLQLMGVVVVFMFQNLFITSVFIAKGNSKIPFRINACMLSINILLDTILILQLKLGVMGAAYATIASQLVGTALFHWQLFSAPSLKPVGVPFHPKTLVDIMRLGISPTIQRMSFSLVGIGMARIISNWGTTAIAVQRVGVQLEAVTYMTTSGFVSALSSISGQAFGAKDYGRQWAAYRAGMRLAFTIGVSTTLLLTTCPRWLFSLFLNEAASIEMGQEYLRVIGLSQLFMCMEMMSAGAFFGWGKPHFPAVTSVSITALRIPLALAAIHLLDSGLSGVWWSIGLTSILKGITLASVYVVTFKAFIKKQQHS